MLNSDAGVDPAHRLRVAAQQAAERPLRERSVKTAAKRSGCGHSPPFASFCKAGCGAPPCANAAFKPPRSDAGVGTARRLRVSARQAAEPPCANAAFKPPRSDVGVGTAHRLRVSARQAAERPLRERSVQTAAKRCGCGHSPQKKNADCSTFLFLRSD